MDNTVGSLTQKERSIIIGSLLGDGYLHIVKGRSNALMEVNHSHTQKEYVDWKYRMLTSLCLSAPKERQSNGGRIAYRFNTRQHEELTDIFQLFYSKGRKIIPTTLELDPIMLAVWYMDDGSKCRESDVYLNTQQFDIQDQQKCVQMLGHIGIESSLNRDKQYWRIRIKKSCLPKFFSYISPHIIPCMKYKLSYNPVETCSLAERSRPVKRTAKTPSPRLISRMKI